MTRKRKKKKITKAVLQKREKRLLKRELKNKLEKWKLAVVERDRGLCQKCLKSLPERKNQNVHHIISFQSIKRKFPQLLEDIMNGILLCSFCHKWANDSPHQGGFEFTFWLENNKPAQYLYLKDFLSH